MICLKCGQALPDGAENCPSCGEPVEGSSAGVSGPESGLAATAAPAVRRSAIYAGFWIRGLAYLIDWFLIAIVSVSVILGPLMGLGAIPANASYTWFMALNRQTIAIRLLIFMLSWLYFALLESSAWQATIAKKALGLVVADLEGRRVTFTRASYRYLGKLVFGTIFYFGFLFATFTPRKQALHDILAKSLVLKRPRRS
ncbi:MAG TPA: RDD family protein [Candidatus Acidoferrales bacterium]|nr:RDD family protein [Candidatus Acidoferrales bacterium]